MLHKPEPGPQEKKSAIREKRPSLPRVAISMGDPNGIGPEVVLKALSEEEIYTLLQPLVVGSIAVLRDYATKMGMRSLELDVFEGQQFGTAPEKIFVLETGDPSPTAVCPGELRAEAGESAITAVQVATDLCLDGRVDAMVTAPLSKKAVSMAGHVFRGHTEFIADRCNARGKTDGTSGKLRVPLMMMVSNTLRVGLVTGHMPLSNVPAAVTQASILEKLRLMSASLEHDFGLPNASIAVLGLNPHAGDGTLLGAEDETVIEPAIQSARSHGFHVSGPFSADGFFGSAHHADFDAVLAMYHDQGLIPFKTLSFQSGVNFTAGLPIVRTSPDHGTAFNLAGKGQASHGSLNEALKLAAQICLRRKHSEPAKNR